MHERYSTKSQINIKFSIASCLRSRSTTPEKNPVLTRTSSRDAKNFRKKNTSNHTPSYSTRIGCVCRSKLTCKSKCWKPMINHSTFNLHCVWTQICLKSSIGIWLECCAKKSQLPAVYRPISFRSVMYTLANGIICTLCTCVCEREYEFQLAQLLCRVKHTFSSHMFGTNNCSSI